MNFAEHRSCVDGGAVPSPRAELRLALGDGGRGARLDRRHHVDVPPTDVLLAAHEARQPVALGLGADLRQCARRRDRPARHTNSLHPVGY